MKKLILILILIPMCLQAQWNPDKFQIVDTIYYQDPENDENYFTITTGNTGNYFQIYPCSGILSVDTLAYSTFIRSKTWTLTITATDALKKTAKFTEKIQLRKSGNVKLPPIIIP